MATHGKAREVTINNLRNRIAFQRKGFGMSAVKGTVEFTGSLPATAARVYNGDRADIVYTVLSYTTPIAWVYSDGTVLVPEERYSVTTSHHQSLCKIYLHS